MKIRFRTLMFLFLPMVVLGYTTRVFWMMCRTGWYNAGADLTRIYLGMTPSQKAVEPGFTHYTKEELEIMLKDAINKEYYELAGAIQKELKTR